jgi:hypothetical protein
VRLLCLTALRVTNKYSWLRLVFITMHNIIILCFIFFLRKEQFSSSNLQRIKIRTQFYDFYVFEGHSSNIYSFNGLIHLFFIRLHYLYFIPYLSFASIDFFEAKKQLFRVKFIYSTLRNSTITVIIIWNYNLKVSYYFWLEVNLISDSCFTVFS